LYSDSVGCFLVKKDVMKAVPTAANNLCPAHATQGTRDAQLAKWQYHLMYIRRIMF